MPKKEFEVKVKVPQYTVVEITGIPTPEAVLQLLYDKLKEEIPDIDEYIEIKENKIIFKKKDIPIDEDKLRRILQEVKVELLL